MAWVLSIDLGTSGCRSAVYDETLTMLASASTEYPLILLPNGYVEQDANVWWDCVVSTAREAIAKAGNGENIKSIAISSQGIAIVPVGEDGNTLCNSQSWLDGRAVKEAENVRARFGADELYNLTGKPVLPNHTICKYIWLKENQPEIYEKTWKIMLPMDFIQFKLCGECVTDHTMASGTAMYELQACTWSSKLLDEYGLDVNKLAQIRPSGSVAGQVLPQVAELLGISKQAVVALGGQDQKCGAYGAGADLNSISVSLGTGSCITKLFDKPTYHEGKMIPVFSYVKSGLWELEGVVNTAASSYQWFRDTFAPDKSFRELDELAEKAGGPNQELFYPFLQGDATPFFSGGAGTFTGLAMITDLGRLARSVMEGIAFRIRENLEAMDDGNDTTTDLRVFGGGSKSPIWCKIIANVTNKNVITMPKVETALAGAAKLAFEAIGVQVCQDQIELKRYEPDPELVAAYQKAFENYESTRHRFFG